MTPTYPLTVTRNRGWYGKVRALHLYAETPRGKVKLGAVGSGKSVSIDVPQDASQLYGKMDWAKSERLDLAFIEPNAEVFANMRFSINPFRIMGIPNMPCRIETVPR